MERKPEKPKAKATCFRCPVCGGGTIIKVIVARQPCELLQWICSLCKTKFGPHWNAAYWGDRPGVILVGPEPIPDRDAGAPIFKGTLELLAGGTRKGDMVYKIVKALVSIVLASATILVQIQGLISHKRGERTSVTWCQSGCDSPSPSVSGPGAGQP